MEIVYFIFTSSTTSTTIQFILVEPTKKFQNKSQNSRWAWSFSPPPLSCPIPASSDKEVGQGFSPHSWWVVCCLGRWGWDGWTPAWTGYQRRLLVVCDGGWVGQPAQEVGGDKAQTFVWNALLCIFMPISSQNYFVDHCQQTWFLHLKCFPEFSPYFII